MNPFIHIVGLTLVYFIWQGAVLALLSAASLRLMSRWSSDARYALACATVVTMLVSPLVTARMLSNPAGQMPSQRVSQFSERIAASTPLEFDSDVSARPVLPIPGRPLRAVDTTLRIVVMAWLTGVVLLLIRLAGGWWRIRQIHVASLAADVSRWQAASHPIARRLGLAREIHVVDSSLVRTPTVVGWLRPVILLPVAALANLTPGQVDAILAHELAHIRRHDFVVNVLQAIAETVLFYHPAVWWVSSKIRAEREHCCDEVAVDVCGDAVAYAAALTELEMRRADASSFVLAATGGSLIDRVKRVLAMRTPEAPRIGNAKMIAAFVLVFILAAGALQFMFALQLPEASSAVKGNSDSKVAGARSAFAWRMVFDHPTCEMSFKGFTGRELIRFAYQLPSIRVIGGPDWIDAETFDLSTTLSSEPAADEMPALVRLLLEERFNLIAHEETRDFPVYALVIDRADGALGPNLQPATSDCLDQREWMKAGGPPLQIRRELKRFCGVWDNGPSGITVEKIAIPDLAEYLSRPGSALDRPVVDRTGLEGQFDLTLDVFLPAVALTGQHPRLAAALEPLGFQSLATALREQLGLRLKPAMAPSDVLVIDRAERPVQAATIRLSMTKP